MYLNPVHTDALVHLKQDRMLHEVEQDRLVRLARAAKGSRAISNVRALAWLGQRLIAWGQNLQKRAGLEAGACVLPIADPCRSC